MAKFPDIAFDFRVSTKPDEPPEPGDPIASDGGDLKWNSQ